MDHMDHMDHGSWIIGTRDHFIIPLCQGTETTCHLPIILVILKDILTVYTSEHNVVDSCTAKLSCLSWHHTLFSR